ncbi:unnamed protein product [Ophioblennius macclurei]
MAEVDGSKALVGLLSGICQRSFYSKEEVTEELLKEQLYPDMSQEEFAALYGKLRGILKSMASADMDQAQLEAFLTAQTRKQGGGGLSADQAGALSRFWKSQRSRVKGSLLAGSCYEPGLKGLSWRVDIQTAACGEEAPHSSPVALMELELGGAEQDSEFLCLEFDEAKVNQVLTKMANIQESIDRIINRT